MSSASESTAGPQLKAGALSFTSVLMQAVTHIGPAVGTLLALQFITTMAGNAAPLAFLITAGILLALAVSIGQLAKLFPSAGGYYTYVSKTIHPRAGWLTAWMYFLYDPIGAAVNLGFMGYFFETIMKAEYDFTFKWWWFFLISLSIITFLVYRGVAISVRVVVFLGIIEMAIIVALAISGLFNPGPGGVNAEGFDFGNSTPSGLYLAVVFSIFLFTGFESVAPLAEETRNPTRAIPRAVWMAVLIVGTFFVFSNWGILIGHGTDHIGTFESSASNPVIDLAKSLWGWGWLLVLFAMINSILAVGIACTNSATRVFFAMGRSGALPKSLAAVHPVHRTPKNAIILQTMITLVVGLGLGFWMGPDDQFYMLGIAITLGLAMVYIAGNIGVTLHYWSRRRSDFQWLLHGVFPTFTSGALLFVIYKSLSPYPAYPGSIAPIVVVVWLSLGIGLTVYLARSGKDEWMTKATRVYDDAEAPVT